jgi:hypothetical protein
MALRTSTSWVELTCDCCGVKFKRRASQHRSDQKKGRTKTFCSSVCAGKTPPRFYERKTEPERIKAARDGLREKCPNCGERFLAVVDTRLNRQGHRRRKKHCLNCNYRLNTIELPETEADTFMDKSSLTCQMCMHNNRERMCCDFETPEYMTPDSQDCNLFKKRT